MATSRGTVDFILDQASGAGEVSARPMFGEYGFYHDGKLIGLICDDTLFVKPTIGACAQFPEAERASPYPGAKAQLVATPLLDEPDRLAAVIRAAWADLPLPKPRKTKGR